MGTKVSAVQKVISVRQKFVGLFRTVEKRFKDNFSGFVLACMILWESDAEVRKKIEEKVKEL